jgi:hypothetical protein
MAIIINKKGLSAVIHLTANATINISGNSVTSDIALGNEIITGASIKQIWYGSNNGHWAVGRGSNTAAILNNTGHMDFISHGITLNKDTGATLTANLNSTGVGFIIIEVSKIPTTGTNN